MISIPNTLTPHEVEKLLADRFKSLRLQTRYKRTTLSKRAGVTVASLKRFETTGQVSLKNLLRLAHALDRLAEFTKLLEAPQATSLTELRAQSGERIPKRGQI